MFRVCKQVALCTGWLEQSKLPATVISQRDLDELAKRRLVVGNTGLVVFLNLT